jgi:serine/threonine-protein kinase
LIQVGAVLDKYELLERVGQGGMAVVYRALDRSLRRQVAIKILHRHLSDSDEARDRFEREAQAVAKVHHENILEIFDYKGRGSEDSYIVTEFIDGPTLKQFTVEHPIRHPEVGALIVLQVCRALGHAHQAGILHRDVKPENIMIGAGGVIKLTDFGISQMVDLQRLTVTGHLLGSPAYMSPEHVEGHPLDFRTDVFAAGIVLYQLAVGKLPFDGRNPHEILMRIAECKFPDPRQANPRVGRELGGIILKAMARLPNDRYASIADMAAALDTYRVGSGLGAAATELADFFAAPAAYEAALPERLIQHLLGRGRSLLRSQPSVALEAFDRVLNLDGKNAIALAVVDRIQGQQQRGKLVWGVLGLVLVAASAVLVRRWVDGAGAHVTTADAAALDEELAGDAIVVPRAVADASSPVLQEDATAEPAIDASPARSVAVMRAVDAGPPVALFEIKVSPANSEILDEQGQWQQHPGGSVTVEVARRRILNVRNPGCCQEVSRVLDPLSADRSIQINLPFLPARVIPRCKRADVVEIRVDHRLARPDVAALIPFGDTTQLQRVVEVQFTGERIERKTVTVGPAEEKEVACEP